MSRTRVREMVLRMRGRLCLEALKRSDEKRGVTPMSAKALLARRMGKGSEQREISDRWAAITQWSSVGSRGIMMLRCDGGCGTVDEFL
jgi:hypothetical protein